MNVRVLVAVLVVGVLLVGGLTGVFFWLNRGEPPPETAAPPPPPPDSDGDGYDDPTEQAKGTDPNDPTRFPGSHVNILVASEEIPENTLIEERHLRVAERAKGDYPEGTIFEEQRGKAIGEIAKTVIREGQEIEPKQFFGGRRLSFLIPRFMRAISFNYDELAAIGGMLRPGDVVDVMGFFTIPERGDQYVKVFIQGTKVLGIGTDLGFPQPPPDTTAQQGGAPPPPPPPPRYITFALTPREAELLFWAERANPGALRFALRSPLQRLDTVTPGQTGEGFYGLTLMRRAHKIEVFRGAGTPGEPVPEVSVDRVED